MFCRRLFHRHPDVTEATFVFVAWRLADSLPTDSNASGRLRARLHPLLPIWG
ncbi:MAG: hypothetical protein ABSH45_06755 [Bryobacteraceae bacterium]|jgi:hypothetical protein